MNTCLITHRWHPSCLRESFTPLSEVRSVCWIWCGTLEPTVQKVQKMKMFLHEAHCHWSILHCNACITFGGTQAALCMHQLEQMTVVEIELTVLPKGLSRYSNQIKFSYQAYMSYSKQDLSSLMSSPDQLYNSRSLWFRGLVYIREYLGSYVVHSGRGSDDWK